MTEFAVDFKQLKEDVTIGMVLDFYGLKPESDLVPCPSCDGKIKVDASKSVFICTSKCGAKGNILDYVSRKEKKGIKDAALFIKEEIVPWSLTGEKKEAKASSKQGEDFYLLIPVRLVKR